MAQVLKGGAHTHQPLGLRNVALDSGSTAPPVCIVLPLLVYWLCDHVEKQQIAKGQHLMVVIYGWLSWLLWENKLNGENSKNNYLAATL